MSYHLYIPPASEPVKTDSWGDVSFHLGGVNTRQLGRNVVLYRQEAAGERGSIALQFYKTDILVWHKNNTLAIATGGYYTKATCELLNRYLPPHFRCVPENGQFYIYAYANKYPMWEHMRVRLSNGTLCAGHEKMLIHARQMVSENAAMKKRITTYLAGLDLATLDRDMAGSPFCCMETTSGQTLSDAIRNHSHLLEHMQEDPPYYPFALLVAAFKEYQPDNWRTALPYWIDPRFGSVVYIRRVLGKYMKKRLLQGAVSYR